MQNLEHFWHEHAEWSRVTFGSDQERGPIGPLKHLALEVMVELLEVPRSAVETALLCSQLPPETIRRELPLEELGDLLFLVFDSTRRAGYTHEQLVESVFAKLEINKARKWGPKTADGAVEHIR